MREKFKRHGDSVFETHELVEMLLYHVIPYRDTNPVAWRLLKTFSDLDGISTASCADLTKLEGIGERCADFICKLFAIFKSIEENGSLFAGGQKISKLGAGEFFVEYFKSVAERYGDGYHTVAAFLDADKHILALEELCELDFGSGAVTARPFINVALAAHATSVIIAHNHPYGPAFPTDADRASDKSVREELAKLGIALIGDYVICADEFSSVYDTSSVLTLGQRDICHMARMGGINLPRYEESEVFLRSREILSLAMPKERAFSAAECIAERFTRLCDVFNSDIYILKELCGTEGTAVFLKLFFALYLRQKTDRFVFGRAQSKHRIGEYFTALLGYGSVEKVYVMIFDSRGRPQTCEFVAEGTVDTSNLPPRRLLEIAKRHEAAGIAIAHNHPSSGAVPSNDDIDVTATLKQLFESVGIQFHAHYVVSCNDFCIIYDRGEIQLKKELEA